jgi:hypothetical protein
MDAARLNDRVARGLGQAALHIGDAYDAFRPSGPLIPLARTNFVVQLAVAFHGEDRDWHRSARYGQPLWFAICDNAYTSPGDYLVGPLGTFFVAAQPPMLPTVCVQTNRLLRVTRAGGARAPGINAYGGVQQGEQDLLLDAWPASVLAAGGGSGHGGPLPGQPGPPSMTVLLPALRGKQALELRQGDMITDEAGSVSVVSSVELSPLGWRLNAVEAVV